MSYMPLGIGPFLRRGTPYVIYPVLEATLSMAKLIEKKSTVG